MGRNSKLTDAQWEKIGKRLLAGESLSALAREFGVSKASLSTRFSKRIQTVKDVANQIVATEKALSNLNVSEQMAARSRADTLKAIEENVLSSSRSGSALAAHIMDVAYNSVKKIDKSAPLDEESKAIISDAWSIARTANSANEGAFNLMKVNKDREPEEDNPSPVAITFGVKSASKNDGNPV